MADSIDDVTRGPKGRKDVDPDGRSDRESGEPVQLDPDETDDVDEDDDFEEDDEEPEVSA